MYTHNALWKLFFKVRSFYCPLLTFLLFSRFRFYSGILFRFVLGFFSPKGNILSFYGDVKDWGVYVIKSLFYNKTMHVQWLMLIQSQQLLSEIVCRLNIGSDELSHFGQFQRNLTPQLVKNHGKGNSSLLNQRTIISLKGGLFRIISNFFSIFK